MYLAEAIRLLLVDDDRDLAWLMKERLTAEGYEVISLGNPRAALRHIREHGLPHLALIDLGLPGIHGFDLSKQIKKLGDVPIIFISTTGAVDTVVEGINQYAEDFLIKPFDMRELAARVNRVLKRFVDFTYAQQPLIAVDERLTIDFGNARVLIDDKPNALTPIEANLLHILVRHAGQVVRSDLLIARVWPMEERYEETLRVHMHRLRAKLEVNPSHPAYIFTERGIGYRFVALPDQNGDTLNIVSSR